MNFVYHELKKKWGTRIAMAANLPYPSWTQRQKLLHDCCGVWKGGFPEVMLNLHEYIGREALDTREKIFALVHRMPTVEPKQGEWIKNQNTFWTCTNCEWVNKHNRDLYNFCPNCGADMRVKNELNRVSKELNSEIEKSKGKILPDYCDGLLYSITNGDNFIGKEGDEK